MLLYAFLLILPIIRQGEAVDILFYEYGQHVKGEQISFLYNGQIPAFTPIYTLNVTPQREDLEKRFTYLRAEYVNPVSKVTVDFDPHKMLLTVAIQFPFFSTPIGVGGYSMPLNKTAVRRYSNCNTFS